MADAEAAADPELGVAGLNVPSFQGARHHSKSCRRAPERHCDAARAAHRSDVGVEPIRADGTWASRRGLAGLHLLHRRPRRSVTRAADPDEVTRAGEARSGTNRKSLLSLLFAELHSAGDSHIGPVTGFFTGHPLE